MAAKPRASGSTAGQRPAITRNQGENALGSSASDESIRLRAYEIYCERGGQAGHELDDWLQAERELSIHAVTLPHE